MSRRIFKALLILAIVGGIVSYLFYYNPNPTTVVLGTSSSWQAPMALVLLTTFGFGCIFSGILALVFNAKSTFELWRERRRDRMWKNNRQIFLQAREHLALQEYESAELLLRRIIEADPTHTLARTELAHALVRKGQLGEAIRVLDSARQSENRTAEQLILASELHAKSGNLTAAFDNLSLLLQTGENSENKSQFVLEQTVDVAAKLKRYSEAITFQKQLLRLLSSREDLDRAQNRLAELELALADSENTEQPAKKTAIEEVLRRHRDFTPALNELAELERTTGNRELAVKHWLRAYGLTGDARCLQSISETWLSAGEPSKALASVKTALDSVTAESLSAAGRLFLVKFLLHLEMLDEAEEQFRKLQNQGAIPPRLAIDKAFLKCKIALRRGKSEQAVAELMDTLEHHTKIAELTPAGTSTNGTFTSRSSLKALEKNKSFQNENDLKENQIRQPSPRLSTP